MYRLLKKKGGRLIFLFLKIIVKKMVTRVLIANSNDIVMYFVCATADGVWIGYWI
jgi:hypothetical protein